MAHEGGAEGKRPPASSGDLDAADHREIDTAMERLGADEELLAIVGSWRDTLDDAKCSQYCATGRVLHRPQRYRGAQS